MDLNYEHFRHHKKANQKDSAIQYKYDNSATIFGVECNGNSMEDPRDKTTKTRFNLDYSSILC